MKVKVCGIELKGNEAILVLIEKSGDNINYIDVEPKKISLGNSNNSAHIKSFFQTLITFFRDNRIEHIYIKSRNKAGGMAGGSDTFKMEGLLQLNDVTYTTLVPFQTMSAYEKRNASFSYPNTLYKYQQSAYLSAIVGLELE